MLIDPMTCRELVVDCLSVKKVVGKNDIDKSDKSEYGLRRTHTSDALGYLVAVERVAEATPKAVQWTMVR